MDSLRVTAAYFVKESNMTKASKLQLMNFLENEATDAQVMALLLDGEVQTLDEQAEQIVYDRWDSALLDEGFGSIIKKAGQKSHAILKKISSNFPDGRWLSLGNKFVRVTSQ